jgi:hypothetical protein
MSDIFYIKIASDYWSVNLKDGAIDSCWWGPWSQQRVIDLTVEEDYSSYKAAIDANPELKPFEKRAQKRQLDDYNAIHRHNFRQILTSFDGVTKKREEKELLSESSKVVAGKVRFYATQFFKRVLLHLADMPDLEAKKHRYISEEHRKRAEKSALGFSEQKKRALLLFTKRVIRPKTAFATNLKKAFKEEAQEVAKSFLQDPVKEIEKNHLYIRIGLGYYVYDRTCGALGSFRLWEDRPFFDASDVELVDLNLDQDHKTNLCVLTKFFERARGEKFCFFGYPGGKQIIATITNRYERKLYHNNKELQDKMIQGAVNKAFGALENALQSLKLDGEKKKAIQKLLRLKVQKNSPLFRLSTSLFYRADAIRPCGAVESFLEQDVAEKRERLIEALNDMNKVFDSDKEFKDAKIAARHAFQALLLSELKFTLTLGINLKSIKSAGSGGARFGHDRFENKIGVVKPEDEGPYGEHCPNKLAWFKRLIGKRACLKNNFESHTETGACLVDMQMDMGLVPPTSTDWVNSTSFIKLDRKECSIQAFVAGAKEFEEIAAIPKRHIPFSSQMWMKLKKEEVESPIFHNKANDSVLGPNEIEELESLSFLHGKQKLEEGLTVGGYKKACEDFRKKIEHLGIYDFLIGDTDCHFGNFMLVQKRVDDPTIQDLFDPKKVVRKEEISHLVNHLFSYALGDGSSSLFAQLMHAFFDGENGEAIVVKHDGGSALPHKHPWHRFEMRNSYKFADLPFMQNEFSDEAKSFIQKSDEAIAETMLVLGAQNLLAICSKEEFPPFWASQENRILFKRWLLKGNKADEHLLKGALLKTHQVDLDKNEAELKERYEVYKTELEKEKRDDLALKRAEYAYYEAQKARNIKLQYIDWRRQIISKHIPRILGIVDTMRQRWELLLAHVTNYNQDKTKTVHHDKLRAQQFFADNSQQRLYQYKLKGDIHPAQEMMELIPEKIERVGAFRAILSKIAEQRVSEDAFKVPEDFDFYDMQKWTSKLTQDLIPGRGRVRV